MDSISQIKAHEEQVISGQVPDHLQICPRCRIATRDFKLHERRKRQFLVIIDNLVQLVMGLLGRWKCSICSLTFTDYPEFAIPYKHYVKDHVSDMSHEYVEDDEKSLGDVTGNDCIGYGSEDEQDIPSDERHLNRSTLWRWTNFLGSLKDTLRKARQLIRSRDPSSTLFRQSAAVPESKYRTAQRGRTLKRCYQLLQTELEYKCLFSFSFFPHLATACKWQ